MIALIAARSLNTYLLPSTITFSKFTFDFTISIVSMNKMTKSAKKRAERAAGRAAAKRQAEEAERTAGEEVQQVAEEAERVAREQAAERTAAQRRMSQQSVENRPATPQMASGSNVGPSAPPLPSSSAPSVPLRTALARSTAGKEVQDASRISRQERHAATRALEVEYNELVTKFHYWYRRRPSEAEKLDEWQNVMQTMTVSMNCSHSYSLR